MMPEPEYLQALGEAVYSFTYLEWGFMYLIEHLGKLKASPEHFLWNDPESHTAGQLLGKFDRLRKELRSAAFTFTSDQEGNLDDACAVFRDMKDRRNEIVHAHPLTADGDVQRLGKDFKVHHLADLRE